MFTTIILLQQLMTFKQLAGAPGVSRLRFVRSAPVPAASQTILLMGELLRVSTRGPVPPGRPKPMVSWWPVNEISGNVAAIAKLSVITNN